MTPLPDDIARCGNRDRKCPSANRCRRHLDPTSDQNRVVYAAWEQRIEAGADRCDGFIPADPIDPSLIFPTGI